MENSSGEREQYLRVLGIICIGLLMGIVTFAGVVWFLVNPAGIKFGEGFPGYISTLMNLMALIVLLVAHVMPKLIKAPGREAPEPAYLEWYGRTTIIAVALREGAALIALLGVLLTGQQVGGFAVAGLAFAAMVYSWPRASRLSRGP
jgi:hypothetical protein